MTSERIVFKLTIDSMIRFYDPGVVQRSLSKSIGQNNLSRVIDDAYRDPKTVDDSTYETVILPAREAVLSAARVAFNLPAIDPIDGSGFTETEVFQALLEYGLWTMRLTRRDSSSPADELSADASPDSSAEDKPLSYAI